MRLLGSFDLLIGSNGLVSAVAGSSTAVSVTNGHLRDSGRMRAVGL